MMPWLTACRRFIRFSTLGLCVLALPALAASVPATELRISYSLASIAPAETGQHADLWQRIRAGFALPESSAALVRSHEAWFARHPEHLERVSERSRIYLYHIVDEVERRGMPMEIALLPIIESAFDPKAVSPMQASGIWQFIPSTGRVFGLDQNGWYDGRRDVLEATEAALDYLQYLHRMFGDWELALAAYNCGEGCVQRAVNRGGRVFANLRLPNETRNYVPRLMAVRNVIRDPDRFGIDLAAIPDEPYFMPVSLQRPIDARTAARLAEMDLDDFTALNPGFKRRVIHTESRNVLLLPIDRVEAFQFNLHRQGLERGNLQSYAARKGESLARIAEQFDVTVSWLKDHNPIRPRNGRLTQAQELVVPKAGGREPARLAARQAAEAPAEAGKRRHTVRRGDTLSQLARRYNVRVADIRQINDLTDQLRPGMELVIPADSSG